MKKKTCHKKILFFLGFLFIIPSLFSQILSYIIPDIGSSGQNTYVELIGSYNLNGNLGTDGVYANNAGDIVRVVCANSADTNKIKIGPVVVSWNGKMISTQVYVMPWINSNSTDWQLVSPAYKIPIQVLLNGTTFSNADTFYIVQPQPAIITSAAAALGSGGAFGIRSRRGAMIVDSVFFQSGATITASTNDCDPFTAGNQGFLPVHVLSLGRVVIDNGAIVSVNAPGSQNPDGGPGGGGGGTESWTNNTVCGAGPNVAGTGFTGGGTEKACCTETPGAGTGNTSACIGCGGTGLNGVPGGDGGASCIDQDAGAGGTGHPFGSSGINGAASLGGNGGGSGWGDYAGGGYASDGTAIGAGAGKINGNIEIIPFAGGSGGSGGVAGPGTSRGGGGGGGGAITLHAFYSSNLFSTGQISSNGGDGVLGATGYRGGGGGSGGAAFITGKLSSLGNGTITVSGGNGGTGTGGQGGSGGAGRVRVDGPFPAITSIVPVPGASSSSFYIGPSTDTSRFVQRSFILTGTGNGQTINIYLKPISKPWYIAATVSGYGSSWTQNIILPCPDTLFLLAALQQVPAPDNSQYTAEPSWSFSQAAANFLFTKSTFTANFIADTVCLNTATSLTDQSSGTTGLPTQWNWNFGDAATSSLQNPIHTYAAAGTYTATLISSDIAGCPDTIFHVITVNPLPVITIGSNSPVCANQTINFTSSGGTIYSWSCTNGFSSALQNPVIVNAATTMGGTYSLTVTDANSCVNSGTVAVTVNPLPVATVNSSVICLGDSATLTAGGANTYTWLPATGLSSASGVSVTAHPVITTTYTITGTDVNGCTDTASSVVTVNLLPVISVNSDTICNGASTSITAGGASTYSWNPITGLSSASGTTVTANPAITTSYTVTGTDANSCTAAQTFTVSVAPTMTLQIGALPASCNAVCDGQAGVLVSPNAGAFATYTYQWTPAQPANATINNLCAANYSVAVTDGAGCVATSSVVVTEPTVVTAVSSNVTNITCNAACDGSVLITPGGGTGGTYIYSWAPAGTGNNPVNLCAGNYSVTVADSNACAAIVNFTITQPAPLTVSITPVAPLCIGQTANLNATAGGGNSGYVYSWSAGTTPSNTGAVTATPTVTSSYTVTLTDANNCPAVTASVTVVVAAPLSVVASADVTICNGQSSSLSAAALGGNGVYTYNWSPATTPPGGTPVSVSPTLTTTYTVTVSDGCGTTPATDNVIVTVNPTPTPTVVTTNPNGCLPWCVTFTGTSNPPSASCIWIFSNGDVATNICNPTNCFSDSGTYGVTLNLTDVNGCTNTLTQNNIVHVYPIPIPAFSFGPQPTTEFESTIFFTDLSQGPNITNWLWDFGNPEDSISVQQDPNFTYTSAGSYSVELIVTNTWGCVDSITKVLTIDKDFIFYAPNSFSPNGDGRNDLFFAKGVGIDTANFEMSIYDRWGKLCFHTTDFFKPWDGKVTGGAEVVEQDVYVWKIDLKDFRGERHNYIGHVTVVK